MARNAAGSRRKCFIARRRGLAEVGERLLGKLVRRPRARPRSILRSNLAASEFFEPSPKPDKILWRKLRDGLFEVFAVMTQVLRLNTFAAIGSSSAGNSVITGSLVGHHHLSSMRRPNIRRSAGQ